MDTKTALEVLGALSHETRIAVYRALVVAGPDGLSAGQIADRLGVVQNTMSTHLKTLQRAGVVDSERRGRQVIYRARYDAVRGLVLFLMEDCCRGMPSVCKPVAAALTAQGDCR